MFKSRIRRLTGKTIAAASAVVLLLGSAIMVAGPAANAEAATDARPAGPCDIYAAAGNPCVAAHSTTRALYASYTGPLYQVQRLIDNATRDIGLATDSDGTVQWWANSAAQDAFCKDTTCFIIKIYDQSPMKNDLIVAPRGGFSGPGLGGYNNYPIADMAPVTIDGHKVYGTYIAPGMGLRANDTRGVAVDDQPEGMYWVINGLHYNSGCCFDYGNAETDSRDDGNGTMETLYYGNATSWYHGIAPGPWMMTDQENNLVGCVNVGSTSKVCNDLPTITDRFVTGIANFEAHHWLTKAANAQQLASAPAAGKLPNTLQTQFEGPRVNTTYDPMRKQGAILLGNGGDNSNGSQGTMYEGVMVTGFPTAATDDAIQANVLSVKYDVQRVAIAPASQVAANPGLQTYAPGVAQDVTVSFTNTSGVRANATLSINAPTGWTVSPDSLSATGVAVGQTVNLTFHVTAGPNPFNGDLVGAATWTNSAGTTLGSDTAVMKVRSVSSIKINQFSVATTGNTTNSYIEIINTSKQAVDISKWTVTMHPTQQATFSRIMVPAGTVLAAGSHYVMGLSSTGVSAPAAVGATVVNVRTITGLAVGDTITIGTGVNAETGVITAIGTAATANTTVWQPTPDDVQWKLPVGSNTVPVTSVNGFVAGDKMMIGYGATQEVVTVVNVGTPGTQARTSADAFAGDITLKVSNVTNLRPGDKIRLDIDKKIETVTIAAVGTAGATGTGITLTSALKFNHSSNMPFSVFGQGVTFTPSTKYVHQANDPVIALGSGITLASPLKKAHPVNDAITDTNDLTAGYQGVPDQWFGGPAFSTSAGNIVVRNAQGLISDSLNYGLLVDPWTAEGYQSVSPGSGCRVTAPTTDNAQGRTNGVDTDSNCSDFTLQARTPNQATPAPAVDPTRPAGPCDIYQDAGTPCVAAHSTTRALYASYNGPLYQVQRLSDNATKDIGLVQTSATTYAWWADAAAQDAFCANTSCLIIKIYDQSPMHNDLIVAPRGGFSGPGLGGYNNYPVADWAPVTVDGHRVYGTFIAPGMGLRANDTRGVAVDDQPEGMYWVINGQHFNSGCCFDYGNAETDSRDDGNGTMETLYYGNSSSWYHGAGSGPWMMTDQENNLVGCTNQGSTSKLCSDLSIITDRFVTGIGNFEAHHWLTKAANAQPINGAAAPGQLTNTLLTQYEGPRVNTTYDPMQKQGAILLGNGGDNSNGSQGTFYEGVMTSGFPNAATDDAIQANILTAKYDVAPVSIAPTAAVEAPPGLQTFAPGVAADTTVSYTNTTNYRVNATLSLTVPDGWAVSPASAVKNVAPGQTVSQVFHVTPGPKTYNGDITGVVSWVGTPAPGSSTAAMKVRSTDAIKINEFQIATSTDTTNSFIELYNAGKTAVDISGWTLTTHPTQMATFSTITVPNGTTLGAGKYYVMGLSSSGVASPTAVGDTTVNVRTVTGLAAGRTVTIGSGMNAETAVIASVGTAATAITPLWQPTPDDVQWKLPVGSTNVPVTSNAGFTVGQKIQIGYGKTLEVATVTAVGPAGTQARTSAIANPGDTSLKVTALANIRAGDVIRLDIDDKIEYVTVAAVGTTGATGTGLTLTSPIRIRHSSNIPFSVFGQGISFTPATKYVHQANDPVQALGTGITLTAPLTKSHTVNDPIVDGLDTTAGFQGVPNQWFGGPAFSTSAGAIVLANASGQVSDSVNYGLLVDPWISEGYQAGSPGSGCKAAAPASGRSLTRFPDGQDSDSNCTDFLSTTTATPGAQSAFSIDPGPVVSLQLAEDPSLYVKHNDTDDLVVTAPITAASSDRAKQDASFIATKALYPTAPANCVSFESINQPGNYMRHTGYVYHLQTYDGSNTTFQQDATFCPVATVGTTSPVLDISSGKATGIRFRSINFNTRYFRALNGGLYLAVPNGGQAGDAPDNWDNDIIWNVTTAWAQPPYQTVTNIQLTQPALTGTPAVGATLTVSATPTPSNVTLTYQWFRGTSLLSSAKGTTYVVQPADAGAVIKVKVIASAVGATDVVKYSNGLTIPAGILVQTSTIPATAAVGDSLALTLAYTPTDATALVQWYRGTTLVATGNTYMVTPADSGATLQAKITLSKTGYDTVTVYSNACKVSGGTPPAVTSAALNPAGTVKVGTPLVLTYTTTGGGTVQIDWFTGTSLFRVGGVPLTASSYTPTAADVGKDLIVKITITAPGFDPVVKYTNRVVVVAGP